MAENGMSRRDFIKLATIGLASVLAAARLKNAYLDANRELVGIMWERFPDIVEDEWKVDLFLDVSKPILLERAKQHADGFALDFSDNKSFKPMLEILKQGIGMYGKAVSYTPPEKILTNTKFCEILRTENSKLSAEAQALTVEDVLAYISANPDYNQEKLDAVVTFMSNVKEAIYYNHLETGYGGDDYRDPVDIIIQNRDSGFAQRAVDNLDCKDDSVDIINERSADLSKSILNELDETYHFLIERFEQTGQKTTGSEILAYFLEKNHGELSRSIYDVAIFMKVFARNNFKNDMKYIANDSGGQKEICERFSLIRDEYGIQGQDFGLSIALKIGEYDNENKDLSMINRVGTAYHRWFIISQLLIMDTVPIKVGTIGSQMFELNSRQGFTKTAADFDCLQELNKVNELLNTYLNTAVSETKPEV